MRVNMSQFRQIVLQVLIISICMALTKSALLYPASTIIQLISSISIPITDLPPERKVFFDWGLQMNYDMPFNVSSFYMVPIWAGSQIRMSKRQAVTGLIHEHDFTANELYVGFENILEGYGYDRSCLKRSICELARHHFDERYNNFLTDIVTFLLTPSLNQGFSNDDNFEYSVYNLAEDRGLLGQDCGQFYSECKDGLLNKLTVIYYNETHL